MNLSRRKLLQLTAVAPLGGILASPILAATKSKWFAPDGLAIRGYDPVAYFKVAGPVEGSAEFSTNMGGVTWQFSSAQNLDDFIADPLAYMPQFGGYCAYAVSKGSTASTQPDAWTIWNDRLYLNYNKTVRGIWKQDIPGNVAKAEANWPAVLG